MRNLKKILILVAVVPLSAIVGYYALIYLLGGPVMPYFFEIVNHDAGSHEVTVEILDANNRPILKETYTPGPDEKVSEKKPFSLRSSIEMKKYTFRITLDNGTVEKEVPVSLNRWSTVFIHVYQESESPIMIDMITV